MIHTGKIFIKGQKMDKVQETSIIVCKHCGETKTRVLDGRFPNKKDQKWINPDTGKQWSGHTCDLCHKENCARRKRANSGIRKALNG